jgi:hypothetical protein
MNASLPTPLKAQIVVQYRRDVPERYDVLISPVSAGDVCVRLRSPVVGETICRLNRWPDDAADSIATRAIRAIVGCFFGGPHPAPRIVGSPDWVKVTLEIAAVGDDHQRRRRLLLLELTADSATQGSFMRSSGTRVLRDEAVRLCPEDADAIYAVTRLALSQKTVVPATERDLPARLPARPTVAPLAQLAA